MDSGRVMDDQTKRLVLKRAEDAARLEAERARSLNIEQASRVPQAKKGE